MKNNLFLATIVAFLTSFHANSSYFRTLDYDDVRREGGFNSPTLCNVSDLIPGKNPLTDNEKFALLETTTLINLKSLSLANQNISDQDIEKLSENLTFSRIINLDLSGNTGITNASIETILESDILGRVRDLPQISGRYGIPCSTIYVKANQTSIKPAEPPQSRNSLTVHRFNFDIYYRHPIYKSPNDDQSTEGMKVVEVTFY